MAFRDRQPDDGDERGDSGPELDLDELACPTCRRELRPWESECPDCREPAVLRYSLAPAMPPPPAHLLDPRTAGGHATPDLDGADPDADAGHTVDRMFAHTEAETREPVDDELPEPPPVGGDPHFD